MAYPLHHSSVMKPDAGIDMQQLGHSQTIAYQAQKGLVWVMLGRIVNRTMAFASMLVLARLLKVEDFGVVAMANIVMEMIQIFSRIGIGAFIIHRQEAIGEYADAAFWLNVVVGFFLSAIAVISGFFAPLFFGNPVVKYVIMLLGVRFFFSSFGAVHTTFLVKELKIKRFALAETSMKTLQYLLTIVCALAGLHLWSLVIPGLIVSPIASWVAWRMYSWRPRWSLNLKHVKEIWGYGYNLLGSEIVHYLIIHGDYLLIARFLGEAALGIYSFSYNTANIAFENIAKPIGIVAFPSFSRLQNNHSKLRVAYLKAAGLSTLVSFPLLTLLIGIPDMMLPLLFGKKWAPAAVPVALLSLPVFTRVFTSMSGTMVNALGRPEKLFHYNLIACPFKLLALGLGLYLHDVVGVAAAIAITSTLGAFFLLRLGIGQVGITILDALNAVKPAFGAAASMLVVMLAMRFFLIRHFHHEVFSVLLLMLAGGTAYLITLACFFPRSWNEIVNSLMSYFFKRQSPVTHAMAVQKQ